MSDASVKGQGPGGTAIPTTGNMQASPPNGTGELTYFRKGFGLKSEIQSELDSDYTGHLVDLLKDRNYSLTVGDVTIRLAKEFGFCYGVERAVDYAYQARKKFPDRTIYLAGEIIHNPHVNSKLQGMGITFLMPETAGSGKREAGGGLAHSRECGTARANLSCISDVKPFHRRQQRRPTSIGLRLLFGEGRVCVTPLLAPSGPSA